MFFKLLISKTMSCWLLRGPTPLKSSLWLIVYPVFGKFCCHVNGGVEEATTAASRTTSEKFAVC